jgi:large subunit ribosomal protein L30
MSETVDSGHVKITLIRSKISAKPKQVKTIQALGLNKINSFVIQKNNKAIRGMILKIAHMVKVENLA